MPNSARVASSAVGNLDCSSPNYVVDFEQFASQLTGAFLVLLLSLGFTIDVLQHKGKKKTCYPKITGQTKKACFLAYD